MFPSARCREWCQRGGHGADRPEALHGHAVPVAGVAGDQQAALFGQACMDAGHGQEHLRHRLVRAAEHRLHRAPAAAGAACHGRLADRRARAAMRSRRSIFVTGAAVQWLRDGLRHHRATPTRPRRSRPRLSPTTASTLCPRSPALGSPHWDPYARGTIVGLTRGRRPGASRARDARGDRLPDASTRSRAMQAAAGKPLSELRADGGASANGWLMQFQADVLGRSGRAPRDHRDDRARGRLPGGGGRRAAGRSSDVRDGWRERRRFEPAMGEDERASLLAGWQAALAKARSGA